ncbi:response regulator [Deinococcus humi]|uniref:CheY-like chemotaxis protein n=1 Tax=Deinococcus humi TaxID=662880 RepID=A0A7W8NI28_9DEIO|nr:response regulator [Deinococcus humi]MBB5365398.1 CheY-like chemotaxis protein [Deinococcus humi]GGO36024.1 response regulator [Deinococcus humi]
MRVPRRYLLVDDSPEDRLLAQEAFEHVCPTCTLTCVDSGRAALDLLQQRHFVPDVVLVDLNMPGMNGFQLLQAMKQDGRLARIPVVMLTTSNAQQDVERAYSLHASSYLVKSVNFDAFVKQLEKVLQYWQTSRTVRDVGSDGRS